jgi:hypothetical protein
MGPTSSILAAAAVDRTAMTADGTRLTLRRLNALDKLRLFKAAGPVLAQNEPWLGMALLASSVASIDDVPVPQPGTEHQIEAMVARLGDAGIAAVAAALRSDSAEQSADIAATAGN